MPTRGRQPPPPLVFVAFFLSLLLFAPPASASLFRLRQLSTLLSLSNSLLSRVANARAARGDHFGAARARAISDHLDIFSGGWSLGWDYLRNYAWAGDVSEVGRSASSLLAAIGRGARHDELLSLTDSLLRILLRLFSRSGPIRELVTAVRREVEEGDLVKDCMQVGTADLEGIVKIAKELLSSPSSPTSDGSGEL